MRLFILLVLVEFRIFFVGMLPLVIVSIHLRRWSLSLQLGSGKRYVGACARNVSATGGCRYSFCYSVFERNSSVEYGLLGLAPCFRDLARFGSGMSD